MMKLKLTEQQLLCFYIGSVGTGLWLTFLVWTTDSVLNLLDTNSMSVNLLQPFAVYGLEGGVVGLTLEFALRKFTLKNRRIWLIFLIPQVSFAIAGLTAGLINVWESNRWNRSLLEIDTTLVYAGAALVFSLAVIGALSGAGHLRKNCFASNSLIGQ